MKDYETLYYDLLYENKKLKNIIKELKEENDLLKKYSYKGDLKGIIIKEIINRRKNESRNNKYRNSKETRRS